MRYYYQVIVMDSYGPDLVMEHRSLTRAIKAGNQEQARERAMEHLANTSRRSMNVDLRSANYAVSDLLDFEDDGQFKTASRVAKAKKRLSSTRRRKIIVR
jgi:hypothetical protein